MKKIANNNCNVQHKHQQDYVQILTVSTRRITTEEKAKVVAAGWGAEFIQFLAALAILPRTILKNSVARNLIKQSDDLCIFFCLYPSSMTSARFGLFCHTFYFAIKILKLIRGRT